MFSKQWEDGFQEALKEVANALALSEGDPVAVVALLEKECVDANARLVANDAIEIHRKKWNALQKKVMACR